MTDFRIAKQTQPGAPQSLGAAARQMRELGLEAESARDLSPSAPSLSLT